MRKSLLAIAGVVIGLGLAGRAMAQDKPQREGPPALRAGELAKDLNLTDEQKQQVEAILRKARADAEKATEPQARQQIRKASVEQIEKVLDDEQRAKFVQHRQERGKMGPGQPGNPLLAALRQLDLTDAQKTQVEQVLQQARADAEKATDPQAKQQIREAAMRKIRTEILTDAQRQQLQQIRANQPQGRGPAGREHKGPGKPGTASRPA
jgi:Spy/CpxP family protein refolding chaperone